MIRHVRRFVVGIVGGVVVLVGIAMLVLPGPAILVIPAGLAILATEFPWARRLLDRVREKFHAIARRKDATRREAPRRAPTPDNEPTT